MAEMTYAELTKKNELYTRFYEKWLFWIAAYEGTEALLDWGVLERHERESQKNYEARLREACGFEYSGSIVDLFNFYLFQKEAVRDLGALANDQQWQLFMDDCDLYGTDWDTWLVDQHKYASIYGHIGILVDKPNISRSSKAEELAEGIYPYVAAYHPPAIWDWRYERSETGRPNLSYLKLQDEDGKIRIWRRDSWEVWVIEEEIKNNQKRTYPRKIDEGPNPLGEIPFVWLINTKSRHRNIGVSDIKGVARIDASILRNLSHGEEVIKYSAFPMMRKPMRPAGVESGEEDVVGPTGVLEFDPNNPESKPDWLEAKTGEPIDAILKWIERKVAEIYRSVNAGGLNATETSKAAKSGVALREEFQLLNAKLVAKANNLEEAERSVIWWWLKWQGKEDLYDKITISRPKDFSVEDLAADLENALSAKTLVASQKFQKELMKTITRLVLPTLSPEKQKEIDDEIDRGRLPQLTALEGGHQA